jgi:arylformamidase
MEFLIGRTRIVEVTSTRIDEETLTEFDFSDSVRVLFKTRNSYLWSQPAFVEEYVYITPGAARELVSQGIKLVGIDYLSVEKFGADDFETHRELLSAGTAIIEGLDLREVEPGDYEMICLPLRLANGDGAPARVVLRQFQL